MINLREINDVAFRNGAIAKGVTAEQLDELAAADSRRRALMPEVETLRQNCNALSKEIGKASPEERPAKIEAANLLKQELKEKDAQLVALQETVDELALQIPNPAHPSVPTGDEGDFELVVTVGDKTDAPAMDHADFGAAMGWVNTEKGADVSGSRFAYLQREAVLLLSLIHI